MGRSPVRHGLADELHFPRARHASCARILVTLEFTNISILFPEPVKKIEELVQLISASRHLVVFTGTDISTSCGIPDFQGPKRIWILQHEGKPMPKIEMPFDQARPGITHMALYKLQQAGILKFIFS